MPNDSHSDVGGELERDARSPETGADAADASDANIPDAATDAQVMVPRDPCQDAAPLAGSPCTAQYLTCRYGNEFCTCGESILTWGCEHFECVWDESTGDWVGSGAADVGCDVCPAEGEPRGHIEHVACLPHFPLCTFNPLSFFHCYEGAYRFGGISPP